MAMAVLLYTPVIADAQSYGDRAGSGGTGGCSFDNLTTDGVSGHSATEGDRVVNGTNGIASTSQRTAFQQRHRVLGRDSGPVTDAHAHADTVAAADAYADPDSGALARRRDLA